MNVDIGNQSNGGTESVVLGNIANSRPCELPRRWELKPFQAWSMPEPISIAEDGRAWLLFGADSGFEALTEVYFTQVSITLTPI